MVEWSKVFAEALPYGSFLDQYASPGQRSRWDAMHGRFALSTEQQALLGGFARRMPVLCLCGAWCGDCINQCPVFDHLRGRRARLTSASSTATSCPRCARSSRSTAATACR